MKETGNEEREIGEGILREVDISTGDLEISGGVVSDEENLEVVEG